ncbi:MAG: hypothetical protein JO187_09280, partial [Acidobacteria bacterium]|nr:hypothetical protein [Acidobacteriota bacterium]
MIAEAGLKLGAPITTEDLKNAAERLSQTGAFKDVEFKYAFSTQGMKAEFSVVDADQFVRARFDNFVWLSPKDLAAKLHEEVPLFSGDVPVRGGLPDEISNAMRRLLTQAGAQGDVSYQLSGTVQEPEMEMIFKVEGVRIDVRSMHFPGAAPDVGPLLE